MKYSLFKFACLAGILIALMAPAAPPLVPATGAGPITLESATVSSAGHVPARISDRGVFNFEVVQQPSDNPGFVSSKEDRVTQFRLASKYGSKGFLAHNNLAGASFFDVSVGDVITLSYTDGSADTYQVVEIRHLQALSPNSPWSKFLDLDDNNTSLTAVQLFYQTYGVKGTLVMQTCIANGSLLSWGRLFVIAVPYTIVPNAQ